MRISGVIYNIQRYSTHDGPGIRTTVFMKGCPLACWWCHNPEGREKTPDHSIAASRCIACGECVDACPEGAALLTPEGPAVDTDHCIHCGACAEACPTEARSFIGREISVEELMIEVGKDKIFYAESGGGITFSGGEPLMQPEFLLAGLKSCRDQCFHTVVDTSGTASWPVLEEVAAFADLLLYDLKHMDNTTHQEYVGTSNARILENLALLAESGQDVWVRLPLIPGVNDDEQNINATAVFLASLKTQYPLHLLPYHKVGSDKYRRMGKPYPMTGLEPPSREQTAIIAEHMRSYGLEVRIGG